MKEYWNALDFNKKIEYLDDCVQLAKIESMSEYINYENSFGRLILQTILKKFIVHKMDFFYDESWDIKNNSTTFENYDGLFNFVFNYQPILHSSYMKNIISEIDVRTCAELYINKIFSRKLEVEKMFCEFKRQIISQEEPNMFAIFNIALYNEVMAN